jgi:hypothetical protein
MWLLLQTGPTPWRYIPAEPPCQKGELRVSFRWFHVVLGWQKAEGR